MKTTTQERIDRLVAAIHKQYPSMNGCDCALMRIQAEQILREQDRDTRYACAEAIMAIGNDDSQMGVSGRIVLNAFKDTAHKVIVNTQSI